MICLDSNDEDVIKFAVSEEWICCRVNWLSSTDWRPEGKVFLEKRCLWGVLRVGGLWTCVWFRGARTVEWMVAGGGICFLVALLFLWRGFPFLLFLFSWVEEPWVFSWFLFSLHSLLIFILFLYSFHYWSPRSEFD